MKTLALLIEYDGSNYAGWQRQPNAETVQGCIERAVNGICGEQLSIVAAGRTDSGVHAAGQVGHIKLKKEFPVRQEKIRKALNANLPSDIRINDAALIDFDFHARFHASAREYIYSLTKKDSVFLTHFATYLKYPFNPSKLEKAASAFLGEHDFTTFSKHNSDTKSYVCKVEISRWEKQANDVWNYRVKADRFVYGMVRSLVGAMIDVARGKRSVQDIKASLKKADRTLCSPLAPPQGLALANIYYPEDKMPFGKK